MLFGPSSYRERGRFTMFNLAIRGHDLSDVQTPVDLAEKAAAQEIHNLQLALAASFPKMDSSAQAMNPGMGTYFKNTLDKKDLQVAILSCYSNLIHPEPSAREAILQKFEAYLAHARFFGASMVASETGSVIPGLGYTEDNFQDAVFEDLVGVIKRLVAKGEKMGTLVAIEGGLNHPLYSLERIEQLIAAVDSEYLGIILDPTNLITVDNYEKQVAIVKEAFERFGEKICAFHLKDFVIADGKVKPVDFGAGVMDTKAILEIIAAYKPYCYIVLEETKNDAIKRAVRTING